jgi:hypothetical protein
MAGSSDKRIALNTDNMRDIAATYAVGCSNAIQIKPRFNLESENKFNSPCRDK